jgi:hypothetical protein
MSAFLVIIPFLCLDVEGKTPDKSKRNTSLPRDTKVEKSEIDINDLNTEVSALQTLYHLRITRTQLDYLAGVAKKTASKPGPRKEVKVSAKYRKALIDLRDALTRVDEERIDQLYETIEGLRTKENPEFDDVTITTAARKQAPLLLRRLSARQVAGFVAGYAVDFPDPAEKIEAALLEARKLRGKAWQELREDTIDQVGWLVAGLDAAAAKKVGAEVAGLLDRAHRLGDKTTAAQRKELRTAALRITSKVSAVDVIRHFMEHSLAELLSNPFLVRAVTARQKAKS